MSEDLCARVCVCTYELVCVRAGVQYFGGERAEADVAPASNSKTEVDFELMKRK